MRVASIGVHNIRSYVDAELALGPGTTLITGDVGAGKTSLLYAVEMALFGFAEVDAGSLIRHKAREAEVRLSLVEGEHTYRFDRRFRRATERGRDVFKHMEMSYSVDGARQSYSPTELRQRAIDLLGFPDNPNPKAHSDLWRWAVYTPQEQMRSILAAAPGERRETIRKALGLEQYRIAGENASLLAREVSRSAEQRRERARGLDYWADELDRAHRQAAAERARNEELLLERTRAVEAVHGAEVAVETAQRLLAARRADEAARRELTARTDAVRGRGRELGERVEAARAEISRLTTALGELRSETTEATSHLPTEGELDGERTRLRAALAKSEPGRRSAMTLAVEHDSIEARVTEAVAGLEALKSRSSSIEAELGRLATEAPTHEPTPPTPDSLEVLEVQRSGLEEELTISRRGETEARREAEDLARLIDAGECPRCHQTVEPGSFEPHRASAEAAARAATDRADRCQRGVEDVRRVIQARERFERVRERFRIVEGERLRLRTQAESLGHERTELKARIGSLRNRIGEIAVARKAATVDAIEADRVAAELERVERALTDARADAERAHLRRTQAATIEGQLAALANEAARVEEERSRSAKEVEELVERGSEVDARLAASEGTDRSLADRTVEEKNRRAELGAVEREIAGVERERQTWDRRAAEAADGVAERARWLADAERREAIAAWLGGPFKEAVLTIERRLMGRAQGSFQRNASRFFASLVDDPSLIVRVDPEFTPSAEIDGEWTSADALSGGERTALALAYRLALGETVRETRRLKLATLILDEPTDGFSPEQVTRMGELLEELHLPQVILVSHEAQLGAIADRVVRVVKRGGRSEIEGQPAGVPVPAEPSTRTSGRPTRRSRTPRGPEPARELPPLPG